MMINRKILYGIGLGLGLLVACGMPVLSGAPTLPNPTQTLLATDTAGLPAATASATLPPATAAPLPPLAFYFTAAFDTRGGTVYKMEAGKTSVYYRRPGGGMLYSFAFAPDGTLYLVNANRDQLLKVDKGREIQVYTHNTYIRSVVFDASGRLYFSEASGGTADGKIYILDGKTARLFYTVRLSDVDGSWAGNFNFGPDGTLWLSSGNTIPSHLYKVENSIPQRVLTFDTEAMYGFYFDPGGNLVVANWTNHIYRLAAPDFTARETFSDAAGGHVADVQPLNP